MDVLLGQSCHQWSSLVKGTVYIPPTTTHTHIDNLATHLYIGTSEKSPYVSIKTFSSSLGGFSKLNCFHRQFSLAIHLFCAILGVVETQLLSTKENSFHKNRYQPQTHQHKTHKRHQIRIHCSGKNNAKMSHAPPGIAAAPRQQVLDSIH